MSTTPWVDALSADDLPTDDVLGVTVAGHDIALCTVGDAIYAIDGICTHGNAQLCNGFLDGHEIECPLHQGKFDVRDGSPMCEPVTQGLKTYPVKIEGGRVFLRVS